MLIVTRPVYYCEFCKRHRLTKHSIENHEPRCIYNPFRAVCGWHRELRPGAPADFVLVYKQDLDLAWLREQMDGCPACMLAVVVQSNLTLAEREDSDFNYKREVERFREAEREDARPW
jgi:hypothetical protein